MRLSSLTIDSYPSTVSTPKNIFAAAKSGLATSEEDAKKAPVVRVSNQITLTLPGCSFHALPVSNATNALLTLLRDSKTGSEELLMDLDRFSRLVFAHGLSTLPCFKAKQITTSTESTYQGLAFETEATFAVSIVRSGQVLELTLRDLLPELPIGKMVVHHFHHDVNPRLYYCRLPTLKSYNRAILMDGFLATGQAAIMAVRVLLDYGLKEENIHFFCLLASPQGVTSLLRAFPKLTVVVGALDELTSDFKLHPGMGSLGDRFFGTEEAITAAPASSSSSSSSSSNPATTTATSVRR